MSRVSEAEVRSLKSNIHPPAHWSIQNWQTFEWHRSRSGTVDGQVLHSSQAFCISVWGCLFREGFGSDSSVVRQAAALGEDWGFLDSDAVISFEFSDRGLLNERGTPQATSIDVLLEFDDVVVTVESKLTEELGRCGQVKNGACTGVYTKGSDLKTGTDAPCRLQIRDGNRTPRRYWDVLARIAKPGFVGLGTACPFADSAYQVMRNVVTASALAEQRGKDWRALFAFPGSTNHETSQVIARVVSLLQPSEREKIALLDYDQLAGDLAASAFEDERDLAEYMMPRLRLVGR